MSQSLCENAGVMDELPLSDIEIESCLNHYSIHSNVRDISNHEMSDFP
jgi:hypothetical protein